MRTFRRSLCTLAIVMTFVFGFSLVSHAESITPYWENTKTVQTAISFSDGTANCSVYISGKTGTSRISGTLTLYDNTAGKNAGSWSFNTTSSSYSDTKTAAAVSGHNYTLSVSATVYNASGVGEPVSGSVSKTY